MSTSTGRRVGLWLMAAVALVAIGLLVWSRGRESRPGSAMGVLESRREGGGVAVPVPVPLVGPSPQPEGGDARRDAATQSDAPARSEEIEALPVNAPVELVFESGQRLIDRNSADALGSSRKELEEGLRRVKRALSDGYGDKLYAYKVLGRGYSALKTRVGASVEEIRHFQAKEGEAWRMLAEAEPERPEWGILYARTRESDYEKAVVLRDVARRTPGHVPALMWLASIECQAGRKESGMRYLESAVAVLGPEEVEANTQSLASEGYACGGNPSANRLLELLAKRKSRAK